MKYEILKGFKADFDGLYNITSYDLNLNKRSVESGFSLELVLDLDSLDLFRHC